MDADAVRVARQVVAKCRVDIALPVAGNLAKAKLHLADVSEKIIASALTAYGNAKLEEAAKIADETEKGAVTIGGANVARHIASAIRAAKAQENDNV